MHLTRKRKVEFARLAGFGLVLAGVLALVLAVMSAQNAGASDTSASQPVHHCGCGTTTTVYVTTTTQEHHCGCSTTTTEATTSTTEATTSTTEATTSTTEATTSTTEVTTSTTEATTSTTEATETTEGNGPTVTKAGGPVGEVTTATVGGPGGVSGGGSSPTVQAGAEAAQQLPFTGSSSYPLAAIGIVFILCGGGLALRKRRLAR